MRRIALRVLLGSVAISAILGVIVLLGFELDEFAGRVLLTAATVSCCSILAMACGAAYERGVLQPVPKAGVGLAILTAVIVLVGIWAKIEEEEFWKAVGTLAIVATAAAHASLLALARLAPKHKWVAIAGYVFNVGLSALLIAQIYTEHEDEWRMRWMGVCAVLLAAATVAVPVVHRMDRDDDEPAARTPGFCPACGAALGDSTDACGACSARFDVTFHG